MGSECIGFSGWAHIGQVEVENGVDGYEVFWLGIPPPQVEEENLCFFYGCQ